MSYRLSGLFRGCLAVVVLGCGGLPGRTVFAEDKPPAPAAEASVPSTAGSNTNLNRSAGPRNGLMRLEEQLSHAFEFLKPSTSLEAAPAPPLPPRAAPPVLNKKAKELLEQRKDWIFMNPDDAAAVPKLEDMLDLPEYGSDGLKKKSLSPFERFYRDMDQRNAAKAKAKGDTFANDDARQSSNKPGRSQEADPGDDPSLPSGVRNTEKALRKLLGLESADFAPAPVRGNFADVFGLGEKTPARDEEIARKAYLKEFQLWLDRPAAGSANGLANPVGTPAPMQQGVTATSGLDALGAPGRRPDNYDPSIGGPNPTLLVASPQDVTAKVLNQWNPLYTAPRIEPPKTRPPEPVFDVPRRKF